MRRAATVATFGGVSLLILSAAGAVLAFVAGAAELSVVMLVIAAVCLAVIVCMVAADIVVVGIEDLRRGNR